MGSSALKKTRVQAIVSRSEEVEQRRDGRGFLGTQVLARGEDLVQRGTVALHEALSLDGTHDAEPYGRRGDAAQSYVQMKRQCLVSIDTERGEGGTEGRGEVR